MIQIENNYEIQAIKIEPADLFLGLLDKTLKEIEHQLTKQDNIIAFRLT